MTFDAADLLGGAARAGVLAQIRDTVEPSREVGGWATVELDRAEAALAPDAARVVRSGAYHVGGADPAGAHDDLLGAAARLIPSRDHGEIVLLEPATEGRLAAALARYGEGFVALYLIADTNAPARVRAAGFVLSAPGMGPFGSQRLVVEGPRWGPFLVLAGLD